MRTRKNINCLSQDELHDLRESLAGIYQLPDTHPNSFATIAGLHGNPPPSYCIHGNNGFLSWHRAYLLELENALRTVHPGKKVNNLLMLNYNIVAITITDT
jgi:hypothetical protein